MNFGLLEMLQQTLSSVMSAQHAERTGTSETQSHCALDFHGYHEKDAMFSRSLEEDNIVLWDQTCFSLVCCLKPAWFHRAVDV